MSIDSIPGKTNYESFEDDSIFKKNNEHILNHKMEPNSDIQVSPIREPGKRAFDWRIFSVKVVCLVFIVVSWFVVATPYASLVRYFLSPEVSYIW